MMRRRRNPGGLTLLLIGGGALAVGAVLLLAKKAGAGTASLTATNGTQFATAPAFTGGMLPALFAQVRAGDCLTAVQGSPGFRVAGDIPDGQNVAMKVVSSTGGTGVVANTIDPRATAGQGPFTLTAINVDGAGDC